MKHKPTNIVQNAHHELLRPFHQSNSTVDEIWGLPSCLLALAVCRSTPSPDNVSIVVSGAAMDLNSVFVSLG